MKISREPALIIGFIAAVVAVIVSFNVTWMTAGQGAAIVAVAGGVITAATTRPVAPALFAGLVAAGAALLVEYGLDVSDGVVAAVSGAIIAGFALFGVRNQVTPSYDTAPTAPREGPVR